MTIVDIILLICFIPAIVSGLAKGLIKQLVSIVSVIVGAWMAVRYSDTVSAWLGGYFTAEAKILKIAAFAIIALAATALVLAADSLVSRIFSKTILGPANRILGMVFGILKAFIVVGLVVVLFDGLNSHFEILDKEMLDGSICYNFIKDTMLKVIPWFKSLINGASVNV